MAIYFVHSETGRAYKVVSINKKDGTITLQGETSTFDEKYDKDWIKKMGYRLEERADDE